MKNGYAQAEAAHWKFTHEWHRGLGLAHAGVDLGEAFGYIVLNTLGRITLNLPAEEPAPVEHAPASLAIAVEEVRTI